MLSKNHTVVVISGLERLSAWRCRRSYTRDPGLKTTEGTITMKNTQSKKQLWKNHIEGWKKSGLSQEKYCNQQEISYAAFGYWRSRLLKELQNTYKRIEPKPSFKQAVITPNTETRIQSVANVIKIVMPNQMKIELPTALSQIELSTVFQALGVLS